MAKPMFRNNGAMKPYTIAMVGDNDAEINLYGEVVQSHPTDFWTGEKVPGSFIALDEFLRDLDELNTKRNITVHINSVGGDFYAGLSIYNRLRSLNASITTINDSLAASAGSIIFMAGDKGKRKVYAGSNIMVHNVLGFLYGYYNAADLHDVIKTLKNHDKALVAAYKEATGLDEDTIRSAMAKDTYMTGQEAVDAGWADEVISGDNSELVNMVLSPDRSCLMSNGMAVAARCFGKIPDTIPQMSAEEWAELSTPSNGADAPKNSANPAPQDSNNTHSETGGKNEMEIKNVEDMRKAYPEFCASIENAARAAGAQGERERIKAIEGIQNVVGDAEMVKNAKFGENPIDAKELVYNAAMANAMAGGKTLAGLMADAQNSGAAKVEANPTGGGEKKMTEDEQAVALLSAAVKNMEGK